MDTHSRRQAPRFQPGSVVYHRTQGAGRVVAASGSTAHVRFAKATWYLPAEDLSPTPFAAINTEPSPGARGKSEPVACSRVTLHAWQNEALAAWERQKSRGVVEAVTGTGKTMVGLTAAGRALDARGRVQILVPNVQLQTQWVENLRKHLPGRLIGRLGGGARPNNVQYDVLVSVVNSARSHKLESVPRGSLLVADECHRYGSEANALALDERFDRRLGLTATYERSDSGNSTFLDPYFGSACYRLGYSRAIADDIVAHFKVALVPVRFTPLEQREYDDRSARAVNARRWLIATRHAPDQPFGEFMKHVAQLCEGEYGQATRKARTFIKNFDEKRQILAQTAAKLTKLQDLARAIRASDRTLLFTQTIAAATKTVDRVAACGIAVDTVHSEMDYDERAALLRRFARGELKAIAAPQVLDEGIDVPSADLAIIVAASQSRRQMIQRMGRVLRKKGDGRLARFVVLYVSGTSEDPRLGAHETFLEEVTSVADDVRFFDLNEDGSRLCEYVNDHRRRAPAAQAPRTAEAPARVRRGVLVAPSALPTATRPATRVTQQAPRASQGNVEDSRRPVLVRKPGAPVNSDRKHQRFRRDLSDVAQRNRGATAARRADGSNSSK